MGAAPGFRRATRPPLGCATCASRTRAGVCGEPVAAGLAPHAAVHFCDSLPGAGAGCPAWRALPVEALQLVGVAGDGLVLCTDCAHWHPGRCRNHRAAGLVGFDLAAGWHELPQRCPGFRAARAIERGARHAAATA